MNTLKTSKRAAIIAALVEDNSIRATCRMVGVAKNTVLKLLVDVGRACRAYQRKHLRNLPCRRLQCDEIWTFVYAKARNVPPAKLFEPGVGDAWTWVAIDAVAEFRQAVTIAPDNAVAHYNLSVALSKLGRTEEAAAEYREAVRLQQANNAARRTREQSDRPGRPEDQP